MFFIHNEQAISPKSVTCADISIHSKCLNRHHLLEVYKAIYNQKFANQTETRPQVGVFYGNFKCKRERKATK